MLCGNFVTNQGYFPRCILQLSTTTLWLIAEKSSKNLLKSTHISHDKSHIPRVSPSPPPPTLTHTFIHNYRHLFRLFFFRCHVEEVHLSHPPKVSITHHLHLTPCALPRYGREWPTFGTLSMSLTH